MAKRERGSMKKNRATDRLSELPDSLIFEIFRFLPMADVVRTTIMSNRWKNLWINVPYLNFMIDTDKVRNFVNRAISSWRGIKIIRFKVKFDSKLEKSLGSDIDSWMQFATENKVEELFLDLPYRDCTVSEAKLYVVPQCIYSCSSLKDLYLTNCDLQIDGNVQWGQLKILEIGGESFSGNAINQVLLGSPQLEHLLLYLRGNKENLSIRSSSLKSIYIRNCLFYLNESMDTELRIWTPNLESLTIEGIPFRKCLLMNVTSLIDLDLKIHDPFLYGIDVETLTHILPIIRHVPRVTLSNWCIKMLGDVKDKQFVTPFPHVDFLELKVCSEEYRRIVGVVEMFYNVRNLVLETTCKSLPKHDNAESRSPKFF